MYQAPHKKESLEREQFLGPFKLDFLNFLDYPEDKSTIHHQK